MIAKLGQLLVVVVWAGAVYGLLWWGSRPGDVEHILFGDALCGPWGCMPPLQALIALHGCWLLIFLPLAVWLARRWPTPHLRVLAIIVATVTGLGLVLWIVRDLVTWLASVPVDLRHFWPQRIVYTVATCTDIPFVPLTLGAAICWIVAWQRRSRHIQVIADPPSRPDHGAGPTDLAVSTRSSMSTDILPADEAVFPRGQPDRPSE